MHVGATLSIFTSLLAAVFPFPAVSVHFPAGTLIVCVLFWFADVVTTNVYTVELVAVNAPFVPFVTVISSVANPVTASLHVNVYVMLLAFVGFALGFAVIVHVGAVLSNSNDPLII